MKIWNYIKENKVIWFIVFAFLLLCHGSMLLGPSIGIDTEDVIHQQNNFYAGWLVTGRQGLVFLKMLTDTISFNPYFAGICTILFMTLACILWTYLFVSITGRENKAGILVFSCIIASATIYTEQFYFKLQAMEISLGFVLMAVSLLCAYYFAIGKKWWNLLISSLLLLIVFSEYQVMIPLFLFGAVVCYLLYYLFVLLPSDEEISLKKLWIFIGRFALVFLVGLIVNQIITSLFFSGSSYLNSQIFWLSNSFGKCFLNIITHVGSVLFGSQIYYTKTFAIYCLLVAITVIMTLVKAPKRKGKVLCVLDLCLLYMAPFYMTIICGGAPIVRSQLILPFTLAFLAYLLFMVVGKKWFFYVLAVLGLVTCFIQTRYTALLNYTDDVRYASDVRIASSISEKIDELQDEENSYPVVFIGYHEAELNNSCIRAESIGRSFFEWDTKVEPYGYYTTRRILGLMHTMGIDYYQAAKDQTIEAAAASSKMPSYPQKGYVALKDGVIIVKLSDAVE